MAGGGTRIFGLETEYMVLTSPGGSRSGALGLAGNTEAAVRIVAQASLSLKDSMASGHVGGFLSNGGRIYADCGHVELATPEVATPTDALCQLQAGDRIVARLAQSAGEHASRFSVCKCNADYFGGTTWGFHENYHIEGAIAGFPKEFLLPHLASRVLYSGAGGWEIGPYPAIAFTLSPRTVHIRAAETGDSTSNRGLIHNRGEPLGIGYRLHILCGENQCSHSAMHLRLGATALVVALLERRILPDPAVLLAAPHLATRRFARDPNLRARVWNRSSRRVTALEIQRAYCDLARRNLALLPSWAPETVGLWVRELDSLEAHGVSGGACVRLDWAIKFHLYCERIRERGFSSLHDFIHQGRRLAVRLRKAMNAAEEPGPIDHVLRALPGGAAYLNARFELLDIDTRYGLLREPDGIFLALDRAGVLQHSAPGVTEPAIRRAMTVPPRGTRARRRGAAIRAMTQHARNGAPHPTVGWASIMDLHRRRILEMPDPTWRRVRWREIQSPNAAESTRRDPPDILETLFGRARPPRPAEPTSTEVEHRALAAYDRGAYEEAYEILREAERRQGRLTHEAYRVLAWVCGRRCDLAESRRVTETLRRSVAPTLLMACDILCCHRYLGLRPHPGALDAMREAQAMIVPQPGANPGTEATALGHIAYVLTRLGRPEEAREALHRAFVLIDLAHPHSRARLHAESAEVHRMLGERNDALRKIAIAHQLYRAGGFEGDRADFALTYHAKIEAGTRPTVAQRLLRLALVTQRGLRNEAGEARSIVLLARVGGVQEAGEAEEARRRIAEIQAARDALRECPLLRKIVDHWDEWVSGRPDPEGLTDDPFWLV